MEEKANLTTFEEHLEAKYGQIGTKKRDEFEKRTKTYMIGKMIKEARTDVRMTQELLAEKIGTKKSYISRLENGKIDIQVSTLFKIFEDGLGKRLSLEIS